MSLLREPSDECLQVLILSVIGIATVFGVVYVIWIVTEQGASFDAACRAEYNALKQGERLSYDCAKHLKYEPRHVPVVVPPM